MDNNNHKHGSQSDDVITESFFTSQVPPGCIATSSYDEEPSGFASLSNSYCKEWDKLFTHKDYMKKLKSCAMNGRLRSCRFRSICWKLFLDVLSEDQSVWVQKTVSWRKQYEDLKNQLIVNPRIAEARDLSINNPLSQEVESPWNQFFLDNELRLTIKQDVIRTYPKIEFYHTDGVRTMMVDILFIFAKLKPETSYRQGMHELLAPLIFILHCDHQAFLHACELESVSEVCRQILDPRYLEHDAYAMFTQIMETVEPWYVSKEIMPSFQRSSLLNAQPFSRPPELHPSNVIVTKLTRIQDYLMKRFDPELHEFLQAMDIVPQIYGIRWVRLLFGREFPMQDLLMLWDAIFADSFSFDLVDYVFVAMLLYIRDTLLSSDYAGCLHLLMKYPPVSDMQFFIDKALYIREPSEQPKPMEQQHQRSGAFIVNGGSNRVSKHSASMKHGSLGSSMANGIFNMSGQRRPGSLVIGGTQMPKSTSEPMNLITDTISSPERGTSEHHNNNDQHLRKGSTASLSHIEGALTHSNRAGQVGGNVRPNMSSQSLVQLEGIEQMNLMSGGESGTSPTTSTSRTGKFFVFGGARGARKTANKQQRQKTSEADIGRVMNSVSAVDTMCKRCATELDIHIGTLQKHLMKHDPQCEDEILLALAGIKQVRDVLKGVLKPACLSDVETDSPCSGGNGGIIGGLRRQMSGGSAQSSLATTPVHSDMKDARGRYYINTPDLLSSDTDINSPENMFPPVAIARNANNDMVPSCEVYLPEKVGQCVPASDYLTSENATPEDSMGVPKNQHSSFGNGLARNQRDSHANSVSHKNEDGKAVLAMRLTSDEYLSSSDVSGADQTSATQLRSSQQVAEQVRLARESSPIDRIASMFRNFPKF